MWTKALFVLQIQACQLVIESRNPARFIVFGMLVYLSCMFNIIPADYMVM